MRPVVGALVRAPVRCSVSVFQRVFSRAFAQATAAALALSVTQAAAQPQGVVAPADRAAPRTPALGGSAASPTGEVLARLTRRPVRLVSSGRSLAELQSSIEAALGVRLVLASNAGALAVSGEVAGDDGLAFVRELAARLRLDWAIGLDGIFMAPEGSGQPAVFAAPSPVVAFRAAALANQEFGELGSGFRVVARKDEITVTGIPGWVNQVAALRVPSLVDFVQRVMAQHEARKASEEAARAAQSVVVRQPAAAQASAGEPLSLMVFRLSNAYVDDKRINVGGNSVTIPGVATLFRQFTGLSDGAAAAPAVSRSAGVSRLQRMEPLAGGRLERRGDGADEGFRPPQGGLAADPNQPVVIADSRMNALMVRDRSSMLETYRTLVKILDQSTDMVQLDAFVIDIKASRLDEFGLGLSWSGSGSVNASVIAPGGTVPTGANLILQAARGAQLLAQIRALETRGDSEILTVPSVVTMNNLEATFSARQSFFVKVSGNQDASLTQVTAETLLKVTPLVAQADESSGNGNDRRIRLLISVQDGTVDASASALVDSLPRTLENQIATQAVVRGGDTLVIGGQVVRKKINNVSGLPFIRNLPVLGSLFSSRSEDHEQYVRIYVVRPRILGDGSLPLTAPVAADRSDPLVHGTVGRVPELIRGSGLSPQGQDADRPGLTREVTEPLLVVPVPNAQPPPPPVNRREGGSEDGTRKESSSSGDAGSKDKSPKGAARTAEADDWDPDDPMWRPPGSPLIRRPRAALPEPGARVDSVTQASRDRQALQILETELRRAEQEVQRLLADPSPDSPTVREALARARADVQALRNEVARVGARPAVPAGR